MSQSPACPDAGEIQALLHGQRPNEVERLAQHIEICTGCAETTEQIIAAETIVEPLRRGSSPTETPADPVVAGLIEKLSALPWTSSQTCLDASDTATSEDGAPT